MLLVQYLSLIEFEKSETYYHLFYCKNWLNHIHMQIVNFSTKPTMFDRILSLILYNINLKLSSLSHWQFLVTF